MRTALQHSTQCVVTVHRYSQSRICEATGWVRGVEVRGHLLQDQQVVLPQAWRDRRRQQAAAAGQLQGRSWQCRSSHPPHLLCIKAHSSRVADGQRLLHFQLCSAISMPLQRSYRSCLLALGAAKSCHGCCRLLSRSNIQHANAQELTKCSGAARICGARWRLTSIIGIMRGSRKAAILIGADPVAGGVALLAKGVLGVLYPDAAPVRCAQHCTLSHKHNISA